MIEIIVFDSSQNFVCMCKCLCVTPLRAILKVIKVEISVFCYLLYKDPALVSLL